MDITLLLAECRGAIAMNGELPVHLPEDLKWFKEYTVGKVLVMGRKTVESLPKRLDRRLVFCLTRQENYEHQYCDLSFNSAKDIYEYCAEYGIEELVIAGGREIYDLFLEDCNKVVKTRINHTLIPKGKFDKCKDVLKGPDLSVKGEFDRAEVLVKSSNMVVTRFEWLD